MDARFQPAAPPAGAIYTRHALSTHWKATHDDRPINASSGDDAAPIRRISAMSTTFALRANKHALIVPLSHDAGQHYDDARDMPGLSLRSTPPGDAQASSSRRAKNFMKISLFMITGALVIATWEMYPFRYSPFQSKKLQVHVRRSMPCAYRGYFGATLALRPVAAARDRKSIELKSPAGFIKKPVSGRRHLRSPRRHAYDFAARQSAASTPFSHAHDD